MASSRSSSPASRGGTPDLFLSPGTKIRALLATVDSSDDEGEAQTTELMGKKSPTPLNTEATSRQNSKSRRGSEGDDSDVELRPRGRLASRMQRPTDTAKEAQPATTTASAESARERVKKMLQQEEAEAETRPTRDEDSTNIEHEDDELPVAPRRLKRRAPRESTPSPSQSPAQPQSPGLFVSSPIRPSPAKSTADHNSESENDMPAIKSDRFKALVERKRKERLAREAAEESRNAERREQQEKLASELQELDSDDDNVSNITDDEGGRTLTQGARPTRKASKKAIEEMSRETQRMARSMQLAHEAKTRKKISKASLFERFNYRPAGGPGPEPEVKISSSSRPSSPHTDVEMKEVDTPPSSPPTMATKDLADAAQTAEQDEDLPTLEDVLSSSPPKLDKGKGKATAIDMEGLDAVIEEPKRRLKFKLPAMTTNLVTLDSDDELEITKPPNAKLDAVFNSIPSKRAHESHSLQALRALAHVKSPGKDNGRRKAERAGMSTGELQASLYQKARQQAKRERDRRLEMLKAQGAVVQTVEERERQMQEVEDIVAKARDEAQKIMQQERADAKKNNDGEADPLAWDDSDDEEYKDSANEADAEASAVELSGSEEEEEEQEDDNDEETLEGQLIDGEAQDGKSDVSEMDQEVDAAGHDADEDDDALPVVRQRRSRNKTAVLSDDEAEVNVEATPKPKTTTFMSPAAPNTVSPAAPMSVLRSAKKTFIPGLPVQGAAGLGLTQIFAGTMDDSQMSAANGPTQSMMPEFNDFPDSNFLATMDEPVDDMVVDSQKNETQQPTQGVQLNFSQSQMRGLDSLLREDMHTQMSQMMELSQDGGLQEHTPLKDRFIEPPFSTVETVKVDQQEEDPQASPLVRRGRLRRKMQTPLVEHEDLSRSPEKTAPVETAFNVMKDAAQQEKKSRLVEDFNRKKSKAKEMVHEQAEESEDEYAGLGGADGEDSDNESNASVQDLIDDAAGNDVDERKLAAFYAGRERANDEKEVEKLFKDITTGMLRRKRGADYDLSDSDDGGEARRRMKRRQFSKMQKALFADERVKKMAEDPGNQAFLRTIEDRGSDDEMDFLDYVEAPSEKESQSQSQEDATEQPQQQPQQAGHTVPDSQPRKPLGTMGENRAPPNLRRTKDGQKPSNIGDVRETLSDLLDDPQGSVIPATEIGSDSDDEEHPSSARSDKENQAPNPRRTHAAVVDRISLKRSGSSTASTSSSSRLAFAAPTATSSFKVPALLRRATTNSTMMSGSGNSDTTSTATGSAGGGFGNDTKIKKAAGKKSGVHGFARENERRTKIQESERRRQEKRARGAERRVGLVGGLLAKGSFE